MNIFSFTLQILLPTLILSSLSISAAPPEALPPIAADGAALFSYGNQSGLDDEAIFIQVVGLNPHSGSQCFIQYNQQGNPEYFDVHGEVDSRNFAYAVDYFQNSTKNHEKTIYLPQLNGARIYTSIEKKMVFQVIKNEKGEWTICAPNPLDPNDPNRDILWDKTEFAVNPFAIFINPTAVDNFSLPLYCEETGKDGTKQSGGLTVSRKLVFQEIEQAFEAAGEPWPKLVSSQPSLIYSPIFAAATGVFPEDLFVTTGWIDAFRSVFSETPFLIDAGESLPVDRGGGIWKGVIDKKTNQLTFTRIVDENHPEVPPVLLTLPNKTSELLAGTGPSWKIQPGDVLQLVFARNLCCAIETNTLSTSEALNQVYFKHNSESFYKYNSALPEKLQFINLYSQVIHSFGDHQIYTHPYDDELGQSGAASYVPGNYAGGKIILGPM